MEPFKNFALLCVVHVAVVTCQILGSFVQAKQTHEPISRPHGKEMTSYACFTKKPFFAPFCGGNLCQINLSFRDGAWGGAVASCGFLGGRVLFPSSFFGGEKVGPC